MLARIVDFLVGTLADILSFVLLARLFMQLMRVSFANPLGEIVVALSNWIVRPLRRVPGRAGQHLRPLRRARLPERARRGGCATHCCLRTSGSTPARSGT